MKVVLENLLIIFLISISELTSAQESKDYQEEKENKDKYTAGYIVNLRGDTIKGLVKYVYDLNRYRKVIFIPVNGDNHTYKPNEIQGYGYNAACEWEESATLSHRV